MLVDAAAGRVWTQDELADVVSVVAGRLATGRRELVFCFCGRDVASIIGYLSALRAGHAVALLDAAAPADLTEALIDRYRPAFVVDPESGTPGVTAQADARGLGSPENAVLLSTSGTTGSPKLVRLSHRNIEANATSIAEYLEIDERERAILSLPIHYSYGLSVLNSHLAAGASVILTPHSIMRPEFWADAARWQCHLFRGSALLLCHPRAHGPVCAKQCRTRCGRLTQAGGRLAPESHDRAARADERTRWADVGDVRSDRGHRAHLLCAARGAAREGPHHRHPDPRGTSERPVGDQEDRAGCRG